MVGVFLFLSALAPRDTPMLNGLLMFDSRIDSGRWRDFLVIIGTIFRTDYEFISLSRSHFLGRKNS